MNSAVRLGPVIFLLAGAGLGLCVGMLTHSEYQIHLEDSVPLVLLGGSAGALVGYGALVACLRRPRLVRPVGMASVALLSASITAPLGWIVGTVMASNRLLPGAKVVEDVQHLPPLGLAVGAGVGCIAGLLLGRAQELRDRAKLSA